MSAVFGGGGPARGSDKSLSLPLTETMRLAWADPELRQRIMFVLYMFAVFVIGSHLTVPIPGVDPESLINSLKGNFYFQFLDTFGGGGLRRVSIFALGLNPYITASIILQILTMTIPTWKKELQEGGEYARRQQNRRTRIMTIGLCLLQGFGLIGMMSQAVATPISFWTRFAVVLFWTAGAMFVLWLGEQISEKGIGNGVSLMIFAGIIGSLPGQITPISAKLQANPGSIWQIILLMGLFVLVTWSIVYFTIAQRRIPIQHMRRQVGNRLMQSSGPNYLPLSIMMAGVIPIIFASAVIYMPSQFAAMFPADSQAHSVLLLIGSYLIPSAGGIKSLVASVFYMILIFFFTYFYTAIQYNVEDISNNLKRGGSFIPGVRPGKQTTDFLNGVISRITVAGAAFLAIVALTQYLAPAIVNIPSLSLLFGTSLLIIVSVALETMRQIEANLLMKRYGS